MATKTKEPDVKVTEQMLPEAPYSVNFKGVTKTGWGCQWTVRGFSEDDLVHNHVNMIKRLEAAGVRPLGKPNGNGSQNTSAPLPVKSAAPQASTETFTFPAEELVATMSSGKTYWKVKGGKFSQYGVTIWPEALEAANIMPDELDPSQVYPLQDYTAEYVLNDSGNPQKVVTLRK